MKSITIPICNFSFAFPKYKTWYKYYDDVFVSVICTNGHKSYIRRYAKPKYSKNDNEMCFWHSDWQYNKIEANYGLAVSGVGTYEVIIYHENEYHRIDSLVHNVAIEFQHSLDVSINEMNSRFIAHKAKGFIPYLVLDFTQFSLMETLKSCMFSFKNLNLNTITAHNESVIKKLKKWYNSQYYKNGNLFLDFQDRMVRIVPNLENSHFILERDFFINSLLSLEEQVFEKVEKEKEKRRIEDEKSKLEAEQRKAEIKLKQKQLYQELCKQTKNNIEYNPDFLYYRVCSNDNVISNFLPKDFDVILYYFEVEKSYNYSFVANTHVFQYYNSLENIPILVLNYTTYVYNQNYMFDKDQILPILPDEITLKKYVGTELRTINLVKNKRELARIVSRKFELIEGFYHSVKNAALYSYDANGNLEYSKYYLFNVEIDSVEDWKGLCSYFELNGYWEHNDGYKYKSYFEAFDKIDNWYFQEHFYENWKNESNIGMPKDLSDHYYNGNDMWSFKRSYSTVEDYLIQKDLIKL